MDVIFTPLARADLKRIRQYIAHASSRERADGYVIRIVRYCETFTTFPLRGESHDDMLPGLRTVGFERRVTIAFVVEGNKIYIEGVFYGGRQWEDRFADE